jgi:lipopolysaccharide assembly protein B
MEFELWWLLGFPLFFALGWLAARVDIKQLLLESRALPLSYFKGLNFLLNEQPDKAIEALIELVKVDPQTIELHFALGGLFRRRGEVERAIRMHQNLLDRPDLRGEERQHALFELGQDYLKAGLLDRAEELFAKLDGSGYEQQGLKFLLAIYEQEKEWNKSIAVLRRMDAVTDESRERDIANYYCELATAELTGSGADAARTLLEKALSVNRNCVRANILLGDIAVAAGNYEDAIAFWTRIEQQEPEYLSLVSEKIFNAYRQLSRSEEGARLVHGYLSRYPSLDLLNASVESEREVRGAQSANRLLRDELTRNPTLLGLDKLLEAQLMDAPPERRNDLQLIKDLIHQHTQSLALYRCDSCGFKARQFYWHCPACNGWETYPPRRLEEREMAA